MIDSNSDQSVSVDESTSEQKDNDKAEKDSREVKDQKFENITESSSVVETKLESSNVEQKIDTSLFDLSDDNFDTDVMTWRPLRLTPNGVFKTDVSEVISTSTGDGETIVTVLSSDSWYRRYKTMLPPQ